MEAIVHELPSGLLFPISNSSDGFDFQSSVFGKGLLRATKHPNSPNVAFFHRPNNTHLASKSIRSVKCPSCISARFQLQRRVSMGHWSCDALLMEKQKVVARKNMACHVLLLLIHLSIKGILVIRNDVCIYCLYPLGISLENVPCRWFTHSYLQLQRRLKPGCCGNHP